MVKFAIGQGVHRVEDSRLLTGAGRYTDDIEVEGAARAAVLRSPVAHAVIRGIDVAATKAAPGVIAVYTGADVAADGLGDLPCIPPVTNRGRYRGAGRADPPPCAAPASRPSRRAASPRPGGQGPDRKSVGEGQR